MRHKQHKDRKSFKKWALPNQRTGSFTSIEHVKSTTNKRRFGFARMKTTQFSLGIATILNKPMGAKAQKILPYNYNPTAKSYSRRDKHRLGLENKSPYKNTHP